MNRQKVLLMVLLLVLSLLIGCAEAAEDAQTAYPILPSAPCGLLDGADIAESIGATSPLNGVNEVDAERGLSSCTWTFSEGIQGSMSLVIWTRTKDAAFPLTGHQIFLRGQAGLTDGKDDRVVPVSGLGDEAYFRFDTLTSFWWRQGNDYTIHLFTEDYQIGWETFYELARKVDQAEKT